MDAPTGPVALEVRADDVLDFTFNSVQSPLPTPTDTSSDAHLEASEADASQLPRHSCQVEDGHVARLAAALTTPSPDPRRSARSSWTDDPNSVIGDRVRVADLASTFDKADASMFTLAVKCQDPVSATDNSRNSARASQEADNDTADGVDTVLLDNSMLLPRVPGKLHEEKSCIPDAQASRDSELLNASQKGADQSACSSCSPAQRQSADSRRPTIADNLEVTVSSTARTAISPAASECSKSQADHDPFLALGGPPTPPLGPLACTLQVQPRPKAASRAFPAPEQTPEPSKEPGALVEYYSVSMGGWLPAKVRGFDERSGCWNLDVQPVALPAKVRAPQASGYPTEPSASLAAACIPRGRLASGPFGESPETGRRKSGPRCGICGGEFREQALRRPFCGHAFCKLCLARHVQLHDSPSEVRCPTCQRPLSADDVADLCSARPSEVREEGLARRLLSSLKDGSASSDARKASGPGHVLRSALQPVDPEDATPAEWSSRRRSAPAAHLAPGLVPISKAKFALEAALHPANLDMSSAYLQRLQHDAGSVSDNSSSASRMRHSC